MENWSTKSPEPNFRADPNHLPLPDTFYQQDCLTVARSLLGKGLFHRVRGKTLGVEIVEVEAYLGDEDPASHAYRRRTPRNRIMFERGGACYVYLSYGMNFCMNVVTGPEDLGQAVLLRAGAPIAGIERMRKNRGLPADADTRRIASGPGKLAQALGIDLSDYGRRFNEPGLQIVDLGTAYTDAEVAAGPRIGISKGVEFHYRFAVRASEHLSRKV